MFDYRNGYGGCGSINLKEALATSCNIFHILDDTGIEEIDKWAKLFGLEN